MTNLRVAVRRIRLRMGRWFWVVVIFLIPIVIHEVDHIGLALVNASAFPDNRIPTFDELIAKEWGPVAAIQWHNLIVFLGGFVILIFLAILAKENLPSISLEDVHPRASAAEIPQGRVSNSGPETSSNPRKADFSEQDLKNRSP